MRAFCLGVLVVLTGLVGGGPASAQKEPSPQPPRAPEAAARWEYKAVARSKVEELAPEKSKDKLTAGLNKLGEEGWELVTVESPDKQPPLYLFKRPASRAPAEKAETLSVVLKYVKAGEVAKAVAEFFKGKDNSVRLTSDDSTNTLIAQASTSTIREVKLLVDFLDRPAGEPRVPGADAKVEMQILVLKHANAADLAKTLTDVFQGKRDGLLVVSEPRTNRLIVRAEPELLREVLVLVKELDQPADEKAEPARK